MFCSCKNKFVSFYVLNVILYLQSTEVVLISNDYTNIFPSKQV